MTDRTRFGIGNVTRFYVPLLLQGFSQSVSYPLVGSIVTGGVYGVNALTAFSQGLMIMFMIGALGGGLVTTGLVFAKTRFGYTTFRRLNAMMMFVLLALQCLPAISPFDRWIFEGFFNLPPELAAVSRWTLLSGVVMNAGFFLRNVPMVVLFNNLESGKATTATFARIVATLACSFVFPGRGLVGPGWGLFALTLGVWIETLVTWLYARPYVSALPGDAAKTDAAAAPFSSTSMLVEQFRFTLPLALGGFLLACSPLVIAWFVARSENAQTMLAIHYMTMGVVNPVAFAALRLQTVSVKFLPEYPGDRRLLVYSLVAGLVLGLVLLLFSTPLVGYFYFEKFQHLSHEVTKTARLAVGIYSVICVIQAVRARIEGIAAARKRSDIVMKGQIAYTVSLLIVCSILLPLGCSGWAMAVTAIICAPLAVTGVVYAELSRGRRD